MIKSTELYLEDNPADTTYPYLGKSTTSSLVVLFTGPQTGVVVKEDDELDVGHICDDWNEIGGFEVYPAKIILENTK